MRSAYAVLGVFVEGFVYDKNPLGKLAFTLIDKDLVWNAPGAAGG